MPSLANYDRVYACGHLPACWQRTHHLSSCHQMRSFRLGTDSGSQCCTAWVASQIAQASRSTQPSDASEPDAIMASSPSSQQASVSSSSSTSHHGHLARQLALKTVKAMIRNDWTKCNDDIKQISGVCSNWLGEGSQHDSGCFSEPVVP